MDHYSAPPSPISLESVADFPSDPVPPYTAVNEFSPDALLARFQLIKSQSSFEHDLPLHRFPPNANDGFPAQEDGAATFGSGTYLKLEWAPTDSELRQQMYKIRYEIVNQFFLHILNGDLDPVAAFLGQGLVTANATSLSGLTPLLAAVRAKSIPLVRLLLAKGADVNGYGDVNDASLRPRTDALAGVRYVRTPLQLAALTGQLGLVGVHVEDHAADDSLVAPDGALALRLAAAFGHREIVAFLPRRRGGACRRWRTEHTRHFERAKAATKSVYHISRAFLWDLPVLLLWKLPSQAILALRQRRRRFANWCKQQVVHLPANIQKIAQLVSDTMKALPGKIVGAVQQIPRVIREVAKRIAGLAVWVAQKTWKVLKDIPGALKTVAIWIGDGAQAVGRAIAAVLGRLVSLLHSAAHAIASFCRRVTLADVWTGFCDLLRSLFVQLPTAVWHFIVGFGEVSYKVLRGTLGELGQIIWWIGYGLLALVVYVPTKLWSMTVALVASVGVGLRELLVVFDPKTMVDRGTKS